jgi:hypothetical protein
VAILEAELPFPLARLIRVTVCCACWQAFGRELRVFLKKRVKGTWGRLQKPDVKRPQNEKYDFDYVQDSSEDDVPLAVHLLIYITARVDPA